MQIGKGVNAVCLIEFRHFFDGIPPIIVVSLEQNFFAGKIVDETEIGKRFLEIDAPRKIAGNDNGVLLTDRFEPVFLDFFSMLCPTRTELVHRFIDGKGKMRVSHNKYGHTDRVPFFA